MINKRAQMKPLTVRDLRQMSPKEKRKAVMLLEPVEEVKPAKAAKTVKAEKPAKAAKTVKAEKPAKAAKTVKAEKPAKAAKTVKAEKPAKEAKAAKAAKLSVAAILQFAGADYDIEAIKAKVKADYVNAGGKAKSIKKLEVYVKVEERRAYYVVNGEPQGRAVEF